MPVLAVNNRTVHYEDAGGVGTPVLALHGTFGRGTTFAAVADRLRPEYRLIAPDLRGHGLSAGGGEFGRDAFVADAAGFVTALGLEPALVIGHSLGGVTAYQLAARRPELVRALVIEDVGAVTDVPVVAQPVLDVTGWPRTFPDRLAAEDFFAASPAPDYFLESVVERADGQWELLFDPLDMMAVQQENVGIWWDDWLAAPQPILLLTATDSFLIPPEHAAEMVARRPGTELVTFDATGHWIHRQDPEAYAAAVRTFFESAG
ncbi:alpha/beta fold hydrolase [Kribbella shirazensis]|uniref:Pimeloyl-ACP methyl ester carboxylesterase n=1 Tax=Kribbella shirazensis TaxID=1105143 RepID=A0A7X5V467_9ACTN|nr:alpha/beta hydrolase [Kribbella shirazensis]NIK54296.1 pimeloyl-ACP methyl ester carboxylesterase [Kribbella shirazensis]